VRISTVLFDLDGTLVDSAPGLAFAVNEQRRRRQLAPVPYELLRPHASSGARGTIGAAFGVGANAPEYLQLRLEFLEIYERALLTDTQPFPDVPELLTAIEDSGRSWGIVTNKAEYLTVPLLDAFAFSTRASCIVCGDSTPHTKPHPAPLLEATRRLSVSADACLYVGDDERDIAAARAAGMGAIAAAYGYLGTGRPPTQWGADDVVHTPIELLKVLGISPSAV
jgi:N-acetyl-D-muramate 6-phosphate phosphatase